MTFLEWLTSSRYISFCETQLRLQHEQFTERLKEKDLEIRRLRAELGSKPMMVESAPPVRVRAAEVQAAEPGPLDWQGELNKMIQEEEDGIRSGRRVQEHEPSTDDGAQTQHGA